MDNFNGLSAPFSIATIMFPIVFLMVFGITIAVFVKIFSQWNKNNHSPRLTVDALIVSKRADTTHYHDSSSTGMSHMHSSTTYYVTFQVESGDRFELMLDGHEYGMLAEGDYGKLTFQGTRYLGFERC